MAKQPLQELEVLSLKPKGKYTYPNPLSEVPQGAMIKALNVILSRPSVIEQRRGINPFGDVLADNVDSLYNYQNRIIVHHGTTFSRDSTGGGVWVDYTGSFTKPTDAIVIRSFQANKNLYFSTDTGFKKLDVLTNVITFSGAPAGLDGSGSTTGVGWFTNNTQVAYRIVFAFTDANNNLIQGVPSQRIVVANSSGGPVNVDLTFSLPAGLTTAWQYKIYRSPQSADLNTEPNDEMALVFTGNPTAGELAAGTVTLTDSISDALKGEFIYTASSQQGISQANFQPPIATDVTTFKGFTLAANITSQQSALITLVSVGSPGLQLDDTVTIAGTVYTAKATETIASNEFELFTGGTPSQNIADTANSLVRVINRSASNTLIYAYYSSGFADLPGRITLRERSVGAVAFTTASSRAGAFVPDIGTTTLTSANENTPNGVAVSKFQQPEAFPLGQVIKVGSADKRILRIIALRDYVLVFKQDGVFQITGTDVGSFEAQILDSTIILRGIETAVALNNKVYCFTDPTVVSITVNEGTVLKSRAIQQELLILSSDLFPNFDTISYGIAYESENQYILGTGKETTDTTATQFYVYNYLTNTWTNWEFPNTQGIGFVNPTDNKLYFGSSDPTSKFVYQERKTYTNFDYADTSFAITIVSATGKTITVVSSAGLAVGWVVNQGTQTSNITSIPDSTTLVVTDELTWTAGAATVFRPIPISLEFIQEHMGNPGIVKHFKECHAIFSGAEFDSFNLGFFTDFFEQINTVTLVPKITSGWGTGTFGVFPWGGGATKAQVIRGLVPLNQRRGHWLSITIDYSDALTSFALDGFTLWYQTLSQKFH